MSQNDKKKCFIELGNFLSQFSEGENMRNISVLYNDLFFDDFVNLIQLSQSHNGWYTPENVYFSIQSWATALTEENFNQWLNTYNLEVNQPKNVGLILAGNIPLVGFHDFLSVLISGNNVLVKTSSNDQFLLPFLAKYISAIEPEFEKKSLSLKENWRISMLLLQREATIPPAILIIISKTRRASFGKIEIQLLC